MTKHMRELQAAIDAKINEAKSVSEGEARDLDKMEAALDQVEALQKEYDLELRLEAAGKAEAQAGAALQETEKADGFALVTKLLAHRGLSNREKTALISGGNATQGEGYLIPEDVHTAIRELRKSYVSARDLVSVMTTDALSGSVNYEDGAPAGLASFDDGDALAEETGMSFVKKPFTIAWKGKLIPISRILLGAERADLMSYLNRWFVRNAVISENKDIFDTLKAGYNSGTPKAVAGWKALKKSITVDLDPSALLDGVIVTNQSGFACLDAEEDAEGRPVLQPNPANPTEKLFQGLKIVAFPDAQLANVSATSFPLIYGSTHAGCTLVEYRNLEFAVSEHYAFNKNQNVLRVLEGYDTISGDTGAYVYATFSATPAEK